MIAQLPARRRAEQMRSQRFRTGASSRSQEVEQAAVLRLAMFAALSVAIYYLTLVRPYSLQRLWVMHQLDLDRLAPLDPAARWYILGGLIAEGLLYFLMWRTLRVLRDRRAAWVIVIGGAVAASVVLLFLYPLGSTDIWDYIMHGRMLGLYGANPFVQIATQFPHDPFSAYAGWPFDVSAYGPLWEMMAAGTARLAGDGVIANVIAFKMLSGLFLAASVALIWLILRRRAPERALAGAFLLAWNPLVLYETLGNGHNDIAMVAWILAAVYLLSERRYRLAILALVAGALVKYIPLLLVPAAGLIALRELPTLRARALFLVTTAVAAAAFIAAVYGPFWTGPEILSMARRQEMYTSSLPAVLVALRFPDVGWLDATREVSRIAGLLTAAYAIFEGFRAMADRSWTSFTRSAFNVLMFYLLVACLWFWPWYAVWVLCLAPLLPAGWAARLAQSFGIAALTKPLIFGPLYGWSQPPGHDWIWQQIRLGPSVMALPWLVALWGLGQTLARRIEGRLAHSSTEAVPAGKPAYVTVRTSPRVAARRERED